MRPALKISAFLLITLFIFSLTRCKKNTAGKDEMTEKQRTEFIKFVENEIRTKGVTISVFPDKQPQKNQRSPQEEAFCVANFTLDVSRYDYSFTGGCGGGWTDYKGTVWFTLTRNNQYPPPTSYGQFVDPYWYITESGNVTQHAIPFSYVGSAGTTYEYVSDEIDFDAIGHDYCDVTMIANEMFIPPTGCQPGDIPVTQNDGIGLTISSFSRCKTLYPVYVNPGSGSFSFSGWALACTPCQFYGPQEFEFQYRPQGTSTWTTRTENYYLGPYNQGGLTPGVYEYRHRNKMNTPSSCYGPYSAIKTISVS